MQLNASIIYQATRHIKTHRVIRPRTETHSITKAATT